MTGKTKLLHLILFITMIAIFWTPVTAYATEGIHQHDNGTIYLDNNDGTHTKKYECCGEVIETVAHAYNYTFNATTGNIDGECVCGLDKTITITWTKTGDVTWVENIADTIKLDSVPNGVQIDRYTYWFVFGANPSEVNKEMFNNRIGAVRVDAIVTVDDAVDPTAEIVISNELSITRATIDLSAFAWNSNAMVYTGTALDLNTLLSGLPAGVEVVEFTVNGDVAGEIKNVGTYTVAVTLKASDEVHYKLINNNLTELTFTVTAAQGVINGLDAEYKHTYSGNAYDAFKTDVTTNSGVDLIWTYYDKDGNVIESIVNAGEYIVKVTAPATANFTAATAEAKIVVLKVVIDPATITMTDKSENYAPGIYHTITVAGNDDEFFTVTYTYNGIATNGVNLCGTYAVKATLTLKDSANYEIKDSTETYFERSAIFTITGTSVPSFTDSNVPGVSVDPQGGLTPDYTMSVKDVTGEVEETYEVDGKDADVLVAYDIKFSIGGVNEDFVGDGKTFTVRLPIPSEYLKYKSEDLMVIHIADDGTTTVMEGAYREGDHMVFETGHLSVYSVVLVEEDGLFVRIIMAIILFFLRIFGITK